MSQPRPSSSVPLVEQGLLGAVALGLLAMLSLPALRGVSDTFGWLPFWLLSLPLTAWVAARALRQRAELRARSRPMATVHAISAARRQAGATAPRALRRAA